ncbi:TMEM175 family protein [Pseudoduganella sp. R-43]|uniref:TMEM175 family protein n=1 Tax=unclassified Pseudoduganella TaxID=2637179 RepID=UPI003CE6E86E
MTDITASTATTPQLSKHRIEALVDGIFAVTMTLLVIELRLPEHATTHNSAELLGVLQELAPTFISWVLSFLVLALYWTANHRLFSYVRHVDTPLLWYTILLLAGASLLPFASAVNSRYLSQLAQAVYAGVMCLMSIGSLLVATRIYRHPELCAHPMDKATYVAACTRTGIMVVIAIVTVVVAGQVAGIANSAFLLLFLARPLSNLLTRRLR